MRTILRIAKTELQMMFYSPVAWIILVVFACQVGITFVGEFEHLLVRQNLGYWNGSLTYDLFCGQTGLFTLVQLYVYLYIPLLTMTLMSRETGSGSIKLLQSSPVKIRAIIWGKYLSVIVYALVLIGILAVFVLFAGVTVEHFEYPLACSGLLGIFLLICTYAAIGLFISCLSSYEVVAAIGTLVILAILNYIGNVGQNIPFVREITYWMSLSGRANDMISGLICSEDVIYFLLVIMMFLSFSMIKLQSERSVHGKRIIAGRYVLVLLGVLLFGYCSKLPSLMSYYDTTVMKSNTLLPEHQNIMTHLDGKVTITTYVNLLDRDAGIGLPSNVMWDMERFKDYIRFKPDIKMKYIYYYDDGQHGKNPDLKAMARKVAIAKNTSFKRFLSPEEMKQIIDLEPEGYRFVRQIEREDGRKTFLRLFDDISKMPSEAEISAAFKRISMKLPKVAFLEGHGERNLSGKGNRDYHLFAAGRHYRNALENQGFDTESISLDTLQEVPDDVDILVIADARESFTERELGMLKSYIDRGKNLLLACEPGFQHVMNPLAELLGIKFLPGTLVQLHDEEQANLILARVSKEAEKLGKGFYWLRRENRRVVMPGTVTVQWNIPGEFSVQRVLETDSVRSWNETGKVNWLEEQPVLNDGEVMCSNPTAVALTRQVGEREQRIFVMGDADCISNGELVGSRPGLSTINSSLIHELFYWFSYGEVPLSTGREIGPDGLFQFDNEKLFIVKILFHFILPLLLIGVGIFILVCRKRR
ncbi:Gldg family protein [Butyricimonas synergistica]|uniref:Gldg family protein n=1 Tax=Butyricimonas synergistica TaxID=544644 RepID=UPI0004761494|nr:Gldg family protein [Butyricimonas synergistica]